MGIEHILAVDTDEQRLSFAKELGAETAVNARQYPSPEALSGAVNTSFGGRLADFAFQCTGSPAAHSNVWKIIRRGGGLCELGFFVDNGDSVINPHHDICKKEITAVGSWTYTLRDYVTTFDFLKRAKGIGLPVEKLITHKFPLAQIDEAFKTNIAMKGLKVAVVN
jgi:threonine dehydrogenase-like Zn-dependent dehydrogenase